jgi:hypothetical protein
MCDFKKGDKVIVAGYGLLAGEVLSTEVVVRFPGNLTRSMFTMSKKNDITANSFSVRKVGPCTSTFDLNGKELVCQKEFLHEQASNNQEHQAKEGKVTITWE